MLFQSTFKYVVTLFACSAIITQVHPKELDRFDRRATVCNGHPELCNRSFGNVTFIGAHNSYAIGTTLGSNQDQPVLQQLNDGIRMLQLQAHDVNGDIRLCHSSCPLVYDGGTLQDYLKIVKQWLDANPNEVLSLLIVNINNMPATRFDTVFKAVALDTVSYAPTTLPLPASGWPTLGSLIDSGKRLITFLDNTADPQAVPYIIDEFSHIWETAYGVTDPAFDCKVNRTKGDAATQMYLINHYLDRQLAGTFVPAVDKLNQTNAANGLGSVGAQVSTCLADHGRAPNFILVDFYEYGGGSVFQVAASLNGVTYSPTQIGTPVPRTATGTSGPSASVTSSPLSGSAMPVVSSGPLTPFLSIFFVFIAGSLIRL